MEWNKYLAVLLVSLLATAAMRPETDFSTDCGKARKKAYIASNVILS